VPLDYTKDLGDTAVTSLARDSWIPNSTIAADQLTERQLHEREYHREYAAKHAHLVKQPVVKDVLRQEPRRPWNAFWSMYDRILAADISGKHVLLPGCGFGEDAIRLSYLNAKVSAFDISPEIVEVSEKRARALGRDQIAFGVMPSEKMDYPDNSFDLVVFVDILHHVDIAKTMREVQRVLKQGGLVIGDELYTHSSLQRVRENKFTANSLYPLMQRWIYGTEQPYITPDERKINEREFRLIQDSLTKCEADYFGILEGRLFPNTITWASRVDRMIARASGPFAPLLSGRVVFRGEIRKDAV
jgi:ubiquinone/menaquinone biosynthesis C-methylase UbiE